MRRLRALEKADKSRSQLPIIIVTENPSTEAEQKLDKLGVRGIIHKDCLVTPLIPVREVINTLDGIFAPSRSGRQPTLQL